MKISIDRNIYSDECISNVVYWLSEQYTIQRSLYGNKETLSIDGIENESSFRQLFFEMLNDFKLREIISIETKNIRTILYAKAFGEFDELTEEDILE